MKYVRSNGELATNQVYKKIDSNNEIIFMELIGFSGDVKNGTRINGKPTYKRLFIQKVYPVIGSD